jgi:hypothetical protein
VQWPRSRLAACTMRTTPGNAPSCEVHVPLAPPLGRQPIPFWSKLFRWLPLPWTVVYCLIRCFRHLHRPPLLSSWPPGTQLQVAAALSKSHTRFSKSFFSKRANAASSVYWRRRNGSNARLKRASNNVMLVIHTESAGWRSHTPRIGPA